MPTPVSSLLHAATLVTAGIYLLMRSSPLLEYSSTTLFIITIMGALTTIFAATSGLLQNDIKRIIAFSTISQLGYYTKCFYTQIKIFNYNIIFIYLLIIIFLVFIPDYNFFNYTCLYNFIIPSFINIKNKLYKYNLVNRYLSQNI